MENTTGWALMQQNPPVNLVNPTALPPHLPYPNAHHNAYYAHSQNPNPNPLRSCDSSYHSAVIHPPGVEPATLSHISPDPETQPLAPIFTYLQTQTVAPSSTAVHHYYHDPNVQFALNPFGTGVTVPATVTEELVATNATSSLLINQTVGSQRRSIGKKGPKKIKVVQSAWCEICKVDCNSRSVLDQHKLGKKHKKNLEKLIAANTCILTQGPPPAPACAPASAHTPASTSVPPTASTAAAVSCNSLIGRNGNLVKAKSACGQKARKKGAEVEDLETKRRKILEGGAAAEDVRLCTVCNVVCNSETVFRYHLAGQKHATMMKKCASRTGMAATT